MKLAVIPSNGRDCLSQCLEAIAPQVDQLIVVATNSLTHYVNHCLPYRDKISVHRSYVEGNISAWWNFGLTMAKSQAYRTGAWRVAVLNDDAIVPPTWFDEVSGHMDVTGCVAGCSGPVTGALRIAGPVPLHTRMQGYAFILDGPTGIRAHEDLHWYFTDDYIDWESRKAGGMGMTEAGGVVNHLFPNGQLTPKLHAQIATDAQTFVDIYGQRPW